MKTDKILLMGTGGARFGMGHVVRLLSLYNRLAPHYDTMILANRNRMNVRLLTKSEARFFDYASYSGMLSFVYRTGAYKLIIVDSLYFPNRLINKLRECCRPLVIFDDLQRSGIERSAADIVIRPQSPIKSRIQRRDGMLMIEGVDYFPLRREFESCRKYKRFSKKVKNIMVFLGGAPSEKYIISLLKLLDKTLAKDIKINVMSGYSGGRLENLSSNRLIFYKDSTNMAKLIAAMDLGIISGGFIKFEFMCIGTPFCLLSVNSHQEFLIKKFSSKGYGLYLGRIQDLRFKAHDIVGKIQTLIDSGSSRRDMFVRSRKLVDGKGGSRVMSIFQNLIKKEPL